MKKYYAFLLCFICSISVLSADNLLDGLDAYARSDWHEAITSFEQALVSSPADKKEVLYWLVMTHISAHNYREALVYADSFLETYKNDEEAAEIVYQKGRIYHLYGDYARSSEELYTFLQHFPTHTKVPAAYYWIGENLFVTGSFEKAREVFLQILEEYPDSGKEDEVSRKVEIIDQLLVQEEKSRQLAQAHSDGTSTLFAEQDADSVQMTELEIRVSLLEEQVEVLTAEMARLTEKYLPVEGTALATEAVIPDETAQSPLPEEEEKRAQALTELRTRARLLEEIYEKRVQGDRNAGKK